MNHQTDLQKWNQEKNLHPFLEQVAIRKETIAQIEKDLYPFISQVDVSSQAELIYSMLQNELIAYLIPMLETDRKKALQILYRVDIPEYLLSQVKGSIDAMAAQIAPMIIYRCLQKVILRKINSWLA